MRVLSIHPEMIVWRERIEELPTSVSPLLHSPAIQRLASITFLGILSPRFQELRDYPFSQNHPTSTDDGTRFDHSVGVAISALELSNALCLSDLAKAYAVAWGLTHDVATWALAHTSEPAFTHNLGLSTRELREKMLIGDDAIPEEYRLDTAIYESGLSPVKLINLFDNNVDSCDEELELLKQVIHSPITPDSLEGIWRCGLVFGLPVVTPLETISLLRKSGQNVFISSLFLKDVIRFWEMKATVYREVINSPEAVMWESIWSKAIQEGYADCPLQQTFTLTEEEIVQTVATLIRRTPFRLWRYKTPQKYFINTTIDWLPANHAVTDLWHILRREPKESAEE